ncbi:MAG: DUF1854 domain-containing protein [Myxococcota bacterium]
MDTPRISLRHDTARRLVVRLPSGEEVVGVVPVRCFPFSAPNEWLVLCDERGKEIASLASIDALSPDQQTLLARELEHRELVPLILRIHAISPGPEPTRWHVTTDRGERHFALPNEDHVRRLVPHGALVVDAHGIRYRVLDARRLDAHSRKLLSRYL